MHVQMKQIRQKLLCLTGFCVPVRSRGSLREKEGLHCTDLMEIEAPNVQMFFLKDAYK